MKTENKLAQILDEVLCIAAERGLEASQSEGLFEQGEATAYTDVISHAISAAELAGYDLNDLGLDGKNISEIEKSLFNPTVKRTSTQNSRNP
ncbi:MAG: hypothetical protein AB2810_15985 [Candidatus Thiodiazotropha endolucinida]